MSTFHESPRFPRGFQAAARHAGLKASANEEDLSVFHSSEPAEAAALFTRNHFPGAPILLGRERIGAGLLQAVVVNSRISNVATGAQGMEDAREMARLAGAALGVPEELVLVGSTGVIGRRLPMDRIRAGLEGIGAELSTDPWPAARGMMTTDTHAKVISLSVGDAVLTAVGKGAGMIAPDMATMLVYLFTDARVAAPALDRSLRRAADDSFHLLSVDTDTSTSDMLVLMANGLAGPADAEAFDDAVRRICFRMAEMVAGDGEGASKLLRVKVEGAADRSEARRIARAVVDSPLVKTMAYGADPNVGRILMAVGKCVACRVVPERLDAWIQGAQVIRGGEDAAFDESAVRDLLESDEVEILIRLGVASGAATALGCDLTEGYIHENTAYASS